MKLTHKLTAVLRAVPKRAAFFSVLGVAVLVPSVGFAWGPSRDTFTLSHAAHYVTFDSITDNPDVGDERNFVGIREDGASRSASWQDNVTVQEGKTYVVRMYVHNNAATELNLTAHDVTAMFNLPTTTAKKISVTGYVTASNAKPKQVYDDATFNSGQNFNLAYVKDSLVYENNYWKNGTPLSESIFTSKGTLLGYDKLDGNIKGCRQYSGYVSFKVKPQFAPQTTVPVTPAKADFTAVKKVSKHGANAWTDTYAAKPGETVDFIVSYRNVGDAVQNNVVLKDTLPAGMTYVPGSTKYYNASHQAGVQASDAVTTTGINVGSYAKGANAWAVFSAKVADAGKLQCGTNILTDTGSVQTDYGTKSATATVTVAKDCTPAPVTPAPVTPVTPAPVAPATETPAAPAMPITPAPETPVTPASQVTPDEAPLPSTGPAGILGSIAGTSSLGLGVHHYLASRRALRRVI